MNVKHIEPHAAHHRFEKSMAPDTVAARDPSAPSQFANVESPEVLAKLEALDDAVFDAINGRPGAAERLKTLWPQMRGELGDDLLAESREQYLRYALTIWEDCAGPNETRDATRAIQSIDILSMLFSEE